MNEPHPRLFSTSEGTFPRTASYATYPPWLRLSDPKLRRLCPDVYPTTGYKGLFRCLLSDGFGMREFIRFYLAHGDSQGAVVLQCNPLLVACYCGESDAVCVLRFQGCDLHMKLRPGDHLLAIINNIPVDKDNRSGVAAWDLVYGGGVDTRFINFWPMIAEFISDDIQEINKRKIAVPESVYVRCQSLGEQHLRQLPGMLRDGRPDQSMYPAHWSSIYPG